MKSFLLMLVAFVLFCLTAPLLFIGRILFFIINKQDIADLWWAIAIGIDQLGGSIIYGEPDWTVSSRTHYIATVRKGMTR
ncbi:MAG: hypothetical protein R8M45_10795, partial [Ghiorsea sp.]